MKKLHKFKVSLLSCLVVGGLLVGCNRDEYLNPASRTAVDSGNAFATPERITAQVNGFYNNLKHGQLLGGRYYVYNEVSADNWLNRTQNAVTAFLTWGHNLNNNASEVLNLWSQAYFTINNVNLFIDGIEAGGNEVIGEPLATQYVAQARFVRALAYYSLLQFYAQPYTADNGASPGLPIRLTGNVGASDYGLARSSVAEVYDVVLADLDFAEQNLPLTYGDAHSNTIYAHRNTAIAVKVRVNLSKGDYPAVITEANKIVSTSAPFTSTSGVTLALESNIANVYQAPYTTNESIFSLPMTELSNPGGQNSLNWYWLGNEEFNLNPDGIVGNSAWQDSDARRAFVVSGTYGLALNKWPITAQWTDYVPYLRYSEILLSLGEAITRSTNTVDARAVALLSAVRSRSDATTTYAVGDFASAEALAEAFLTERNIEFLGEGLRTADLKRLGRALPAKGNIAAVQPSAQNYIWPISANELFYNQLMTDN